MNNKSKKVFVGMSGGVDSSLTAALLVEQGYDVTGVYMKNWSKDLPGFPCPWRDDYMDAKRVAVSLGIPFEMYDFEQEYFDRVVQYMIDGFVSGITPNPDIMCNQEIKFKLFYDTARANGADFIATGHYAKTKDGELLQAKDKNKDQTYFLYRVEKEALQHTLFPLGDMTKPEVREEAKKRGLVTASKKESMGICFVGKVGIKDFLTTYLKKQGKSQEYIKSGDIVDEHGTVVGEHDGAIFYTIGQRHGLDIGGGLPYYVTGKDMETNTVLVTNDIGNDDLWSSELVLESTHWISKPPHEGQKVMVRTRHRAALVEGHVTKLSEKSCTISLSEKIRACTPGQSAVVYDNDACLGGGVISC